MSEFEDFDNPSTDNGSQETQSMSLMGGIAAGALPSPDDFGVNDGSSNKKQITQQSFLIGLIVTVVAFGALMVMRMTQKDLSASAASAETREFMDNLDARLASLDKMAPDDPLNPENIKKLFGDTAAIVAAIENDPTVKQVPLSQVQMNPFTRAGATKGPAVVHDDADEVEAERTAQLRRYYAELARMKIQSLVGGNRPRAFIGGDLYKVGETVGSFKIVSIDNRKIVFTAPGFTLRDSETPFALGMNRRN